MYKEQNHPICNLLDDFHTLLQSKYLSVYQICPYTELYQSMHLHTHKEDIQRLNAIRRGQRYIYWYH